MYFFKIDWSYLNVCSMKLLSMTTHYRTNPNLTIWNSSSCHSGWRIFNLRNLKTVYCHAQIHRLAANKLWQCRIRKWMPSQLLFNEDPTFIPLWSTFFASVCESVPAICYFVFIEELIRNSPKLIVLVRHSVQVRTNKVHLPNWNWNAKKCTWFYNRIHFTERRPYSRLRRGTAQPWHAIT